MDPLSMINAQMNSFLAAANQQLVELNANFTRTMTQAFTTFNKFAPHNVIPQMLQGAGTFNATMTTADLNRKNFHG